eukprot:gene19490-23305_t
MIDAAEIAEPSIGRNHIREHSMDATVADVAEIAAFEMESSADVAALTFILCYQPAVCQSLDSMLVYLRLKLWGTKVFASSQDAGDHPPITPVRSATEHEVGGGDAWRVYDYVARHFIASLSPDCRLTRTSLL